MATQHQVSSALHKIRDQYENANALSAASIIVLLEVVEMILSFALKHLIRDGKVKAPGWRVWLYPAIITLLIRSVRKITKAF